MRRNAYASHLMALLPLLVAGVLLSSPDTAALQSPDSSAAASSSAGFNETLLVRPLHDGKLLLHWEFELRETGMTGRHFTVFPKALGQVLWSQRVHALSLTLSSGRWLTDQFGYADSAPAEEQWSTVATNGSNAAADAGMTRVPRTQQAPQGAELWAVFDHEGSPHADSARASVDARWVELQAALSGLFCASLNQMSSSSSSDPSALLRPAHDASASSFRYATLPRESVCTENLSPIVKMLPCRRERGLAALLNPHKLFNAHYHSIQLRVEPLFAAGSAGQVVDGWVLRQSVSVVLDPQLLLQTPSWDLAKLLGSKDNAAQGAACACPLSQHASIHLHITPAFAERFPSSVALLLSPTVAASAATGQRASFELIPSQSHHLVRQAQGHTMLSFDLKRPSSSSFTYSACPRGGVNLGIRYAPARGAEISSIFAPRALGELISSSAARRSSAGEEQALSPLENPIVVQRYLAGTSLQSSHVYTHIHNPSSTESFVVRIMDSLPSFMLVRFSSLELRDARSGLPLPEEVVLARSYVPAVLRSSPTQLGFLLLLRPLTTISIGVAFEKSMLRGEEYPPDVSRGFDVGAAMVGVWREEDWRRANASLHSAAAASAKGARRSVSSPLPSTPAPRPERLFYTSGLILSLPFPDFSMPFNVIAFSSTLLAFFFGAVFNATQASYAELLKRKPAARLGNDGKPLPRSPLEKVKAWWARRKESKKQQPAQAEAAQMPAATIAATTAVAEEHEDAKEK